jgi:hypothetical protein
MAPVEMVIFLNIMADFDLNTTENNMETEFSKIHLDQSKKAELGNVDLRIPLISPITLTGNLKVRGKLIHVKLK